MKCELFAITAACLASCHSPESQQSKPESLALSSLKNQKVCAVSPDKRFGVTVSTDINAVDSNCLVEVKTGRVLAELPGWTGFERMNHGGYEGRWSEVGNVLVWLVAGKWSSDSVVVVKLNGDQVEWTKDISPHCQRAILNGAKGADPAGYEREKIRNKGSGAAYPDGFTIDVSIEDKTPLQLPLSIHVDLTSDPKGIRSQWVKPIPNFEAWLDATLDIHGNLSLGEVHMERRPGLKNGWSP